MFGTIKPTIRALPQNQKQAYRAMYCGVCSGLGEHFSTATRATLSHDTVLLATLAEGLIETPSEPARTRCPMMPLHHRPTVDATNFPIRYASAVHSFLIDQWFADKVVDGNRAARVARKRWQPQARHAIDMLETDGLSLAPFKALEQKQAAVERRRAPTMRQASDATETLLGALFAHVATHTPDGEEQRATLDALGRNIGRIIYLSDALQDINKDFKRDHFNPCIVTARGERTISTSRIDDCVKTLRSTLGELDDLLAALPLRRHRKVLEHILLVQWPQRVEKFIARAYVLAEYDPSQRTLKQRAIALQLAIFALFWQVITMFKQAWGFQRNALRMAMGKQPTTCKPQVMYAVAYANNRSGPSIQAMNSDDLNERDRKERQRDDIAEEVVDSCDCCCDVFDCCSDCDCACSGCDSCDGFDGCCSVCECCSCDC